MSNRIVICTVLFAFILMLSSSKLLEAGAEQRVKLESQTFKGYQRWAGELRVKKSKTLDRNLDTDVPVLSEVIPGMSLQTQWLDGTLKILLSRTIKRPEFDLKTNREIEERWILAEGELIKVPNDLNRMVKSIEFVKRMSTLGHKSYQLMAAKKGVKANDLLKSSAMSFFFGSDAKREEFFEKFNSGTGNEISGLQKVLSDYLVDENKNDNKTLARHFKLMDAKLRDKFCAWVVDDVYKRIESPKAKRIKLMFESKKSFSTGTNKVIENKFDKKVKIRMEDFIAVLLMLAEAE